MFTAVIFQGLCIGDEIVEFGSVNPSNFHNLHNIASVVQHSEGVREVIQLLEI